MANSRLSLHCTVDTLDTSIPPTLSVTSVNEIQLYNTLFVPLKSANIITIMFRPIRTHQYSSESEIPSMSHHFQILSLCERKNLRDLCRESNPGPLNYMSRAHYLYHWIRDLDLASSFLKQPKMRDLGVHFPKIFRGRAPGPPFSRGLRPLCPSPPISKHLPTPLSMFPRQDHFYRYAE